MPRIDAEHRGPLINIAAWFLLVTMILFTASKVVTKWRMVRRLQNDDYLIVLAMLTATGQCIAASEQAQHGLGQVQTNLSAGDFDRFQKASYIDEIFYIFTIYLSKLAALQFLVILARPNEQSLRRVTVRGTVGFIILWLLIAFVCIAFQCKIPTPWNYDSGQCFDQARTISASMAAGSRSEADDTQLAFWSVNAAIDVITTIMIGLMPIYLLYNLQLPKDNKRLAMLSFTPNLTTIPLTVLRIVYIAQAFHSPDKTKSSFNAELVTVIQTNYSVIASCLPFLKPFLDSLAIGLMTNDIRIPLQNDNKTTGKDGKMNPFAILGGGKSYAQRTGYGSWTRSIINTGKGSKVNEQEHELRDVERYGSRERMVINQTKTAEVTSEPRTLEPGEPKVPESSVPPPSSVSISAGGPIPKPGYGP